jgi:uncharacterized protein involved in response to NO
MTTAEFLSMAVGVANLALVIVLLVHLRRLGLRPPVPLVALMLVFALRALARLVPTLGEEPAWFAPALDIALFIVLLMVVVMARRVVETFAHERDRLQRAQVDYDDALHRHESNVAALHRDALDRLDAALTALETGTTDTSDALVSARGALATLRADEAG